MTDTLAASRWLTDTGYKEIDPRAIVHPTAKIADDVTIGPWTIIGPDVEIGEGCIIGPHVVINGPTKMGKNNRIYQYASIGDDPQDKKYASENTILEIGDNNTIREFVTINRGTVQGGGLTKVGHNNWIMAYCHIAHDCIVHNNTIFSNNASLAGHVVVHDYAIVSAFAGIHQFCSVGAHSFVAKASYTSKDVLAYTLVAGHNASVCGLNLEGLKRKGMSVETIENLRRAYKIVFRQGLTVHQALVDLHEMLPRCPEVKLMIDGLKESKRGIVR